MYTSTQNHKELDCWLCLQQLAFLTFTSSGLVLSYPSLSYSSSAIIKELQSKHREESGRCVRNLRWLEWLKLILVLREFVSVKSCQAQMQTRLISMLIWLKQWFLDVPQQLFHLHFISFCKWFRLYHLVYDSTLNKVISTQPNLRNKPQRVHPWLAFFNLLASKYSTSSWRKLSIVGNCKLPTVVVYRRHLITGYRRLPAVKSGWMLIIGHRKYLTTGSGGLLTTGYGRLPTTTGYG